MNAHALSERKFYSEPWRNEVSAKIVSIQDGGEHAMCAKIKLDSTIFYPEGGGQPPDSGSIGDEKVIDVQEIEGEIWHYIAKDAAARLKEGMTVNIRIDAGKRHYHTQQHTGQHLLSAVLAQEYAIHTLSFHLGTEYCTIDITAKNPSTFYPREIELKVEQWIARDVPVHVHYCPPEDLSSFKLRKKPPANESVIRVVEIEGYDWSPCGGTHLERTGQIRTLKILSTERYKGNLRLYFVAGDRAIEALSRTYESAQEAARFLNTKIENLVDRIKEIDQKTFQNERTLKKYAQRSAEATAKLVMSQTAPAEPLLFSIDDDDEESAMQLAKASCALERTAVVVLDSEKSILIQIPPHNNLLSLAVALKDKMLEMGGKGGGNATFFRAQFASVDAMRAFLVEVNEFLRDSKKGR